MRVWERRYAIGTFAFATLLGMFSARTFMLQDPVSHMVATGLIFGFAAGLVARMSVRARLGGDEFVVVQRGVGHRDVAEMLA
ncbi:MAG: hypothetical protein ACHQAQ_06865 [Hyphomicrobiales bacterium]